MHPAFPSDNLKFYIIFFIKYIYVNSEVIAYSIFFPQFFNIADFNGWEFSCLIYVYVKKVCLSQNQSVFKNKILLITFLR